MAQMKTRRQVHARSRGKRNAKKKITKKLSLPHSYFEQSGVVPGEIILGQGDIVAFEGRKTVELTVANTGDRPIQVGSHCHFFEANRALRFDREKVFGFRLQIPAGTAVRFEPGEEKRVTLVAFGGNRVAHGINGLTNGALDDRQVKAQALKRAAERGFVVKDSELLRKAVAEFEARMIADARARTKSKR